MYVQVDKRCMIKPSNTPLTTTACPSAKSGNGLAFLPNEWVGECKQHGDTDTDQESSIDQTGQQEHLGLQSVHQFWLTSGCFQIFTTHQGDTNASAKCAQTDDDTASKSNESYVGHDNSLVKNQV